MTDAKPPAQFDWATELSDAQGHVTLSAQEAKEIGARLRSMGAKLKTYEDLGDAGSDVQLLRTGYAAARLEIESLKAQLHAAKRINAAQFGLLAASIPGSALRASHGQAPAGAAEPTEQQILEAVFAPAQPAVEASRFGSPELQAMIIARCVEKDQADSVQEDTARYRRLRERSSTMFVNISISINGEGAEIAATLDSAVDAARKQGANHD